MEQWLSDNLENLKEANNFLLGLKYGKIENAKLISGGLLNDIIQTMKEKMSGSSNEIFIYSCVSFLLQIFKILILIYF